jgi:hypothetical protein
MARRRQAPIRLKTRTRDHIVADLAVNYVERQVLLAGCTMQEITSDYGVDVVLFIFTPAGEPERGALFLQVKGTERTLRVSAGKEISFRVERNDLLYWRNEAFPVILIVYDATEDRAWWLHVQGYMHARPGLNLFAAGKTVTVRIPVAQEFTPLGVRQIAPLRFEQPT